MLAGAEAEGDTDADVDEDDTLADSMSEILGQPPLAAASREPAQLVAGRADVSGASPRAESAGRLVGADPAALQPAPQPVAPVTQTSSQAAPATPSPQPASTPAPAPAAPAALRTPRDVIRATLMAQAAAWNEGNLDAFMASYWKSEELKFVSGVNITRGWDATLKRYRERYSGGSGLGALSFENLEVKLITDDVATVTGRFKLVKDGATSGGVFSLVMRRDNGAWRIVHDHTSSDPVVQ